NDYKSETFRVKIRPAPMVTDWRVTYRYPQYTGEPNRTAFGGDIDALEGTVAEIEVTANCPVVTGQLLLELDGKPQTQPLFRVEDSDNVLKGAFTLTKDGTYRVDFEDSHGVSPQVRPIKQIKVRSDLAPMLDFVEPEPAEVTKPANGKFLM